MHPFRAVLAGRDQGPMEIQTTIREVIGSNTMPILRYSPLFYS